MDSKRLEAGVDALNTHGANVMEIASKVLQELSNRSVPANYFKQFSGADAQIWSTLHYLFQQAAYKIMRPSNLSIYLEEIGVKKELADQLADVWNSEAKSVVEHLKTQTIFPRVNSVESSIHYHIAGTAEAPTKSPLVLLELKLDKSHEEPPLTLEFNEEELSSFYKMLEEIQESLDTVL